MRNVATIKRLIGSAHDVSSAVIVFFLSYVLVLGVDATLALPHFYFKAGLFGIAAAVFFFIFALNRGSWRYASLADLLAIAKASVALTLTFAAASFLYDRAASLPRSVPPVMVVFLVFFLGAPRIAYRLFRDGQLMTLYKRPKPSRMEGRTVLLYGFTNQAEAFIRAVHRTPKVGFGIVGIIDDSEGNRKMRVHGTKVLGTLADLPRLARRREDAGLNPSELVISRRDLSPEELSMVVDAAAEVGMAARMLPDLTDLHDLTGQPALEPKAINLADLLGRPENQIDTVDVARLIDGRSVLITGAGGSIGSELVRQVCGFNPALLVLTDSSEHFLYTIDMEVREAFADIEIEAHVADVRDRDRIAKLFERYRPDVVFHAAALKQVPMVESNAIEAIKTNALGTMNLADAALAYEARAFVMISTDKAVNPTNVMGATKRAAEAYCQMLDLTSEHTRFKTVRFGNVIGSNGSVVPRFGEQIAKGGPVTVTHPEIVRYFMSIPEAVRLVLQAASHGMKVTSDRGKILVLDMGKPVSILELATKMIQLAGYRPGVDIKIAFTGLRPGEKLYEELFDDTEIVSPPTGHGYSIATPRANDEKQLQKTFSELKNAVNAQDETKSIKLLLKIVPEYTGNILTALASQDRDRLKSTGVASKPANQC